MKDEGRQALKRERNLTDEQAAKIPEEDVIDAAVAVV